MTHAAGRALTLLGLLQQRRTWSGAELRDRLEVSERTLRRDIEHLRGLGYGIESEPGVAGGYRLGPGASVPPLTLTSQEAVAIAVGVRGSVFGPVTGLEDAAASVLAKLEHSLSPTARSWISEVEQATVQLVGTAADADIEVDVLLTVARAISEARQLPVEYQRHDGESRRRTIEPHRIVRTRARWYLIAWDSDRQAWRTLRLDRLTPRPPLGRRFHHRTIPDDQLRALTSHGIATAPYPFRARLLVHAPLHVVSQHLGPTVVELADDGHGATIVTTGAHSLDEIALYVGLSGFAFTVLDSDELRDTLIRLADRFARAASTEPGPPQT